MACVFPETFIFNNKPILRTAVWLYSHHKASKAILRAPRFYLGGGEKLSPFGHLRAIPLPFPTPLFQTAKTAWKEAEVLGTCNGLMPGRVQVCWAPKRQKEGRTYQELDGAPK